MSTITILFLSALAGIVVALVLFLMGISMAKEIRSAKSISFGAEEGDDRNPTRDVWGM